ncbi:hypothetical protein ACJ6WD_10985 [Streptomyces sp. VTCC 41912]|uniref:hypothetical protein n=1 Tax=Streptomyces sp. VTCC 41912 TaxID=3383243 RepID=UPI003896983B
MATIHIAVAGSGPVDKDTVTELLDDWAHIDSKGHPTTDDEVNLVLPAAADHVTHAVKAVYNWSGEVDPEVPYTAVVAQTLDKASKVIRDHAEDAVPARDEEVTTVLGRTLAERDGDRYLFVAGDEGDDDLRDLVEYAHAEGITVLDLRDALKQIHPPEPEVEGEVEDQADEEPCKGGTQSLVPLPKQPPATKPEEPLKEEAAAHHDVVRFERYRPPNADVVEVLEAVTKHLRLVDESNAAANLIEVHYRPITILAMNGLERVKAAAVQAAELVEEPAKRTTGKVRKEWLNPKTNQWEPLRGRPRKDVKIREVAV